MLLLKVLLWSPAFQVFILGLGALISFIISYSKGHVNLYLPFISELGAYSPEICIFSFFLYLGSLVGIFICGIRFLIILNQKDERKFIYINIISFILGILSMLGLAGVAAFPMTTVFWAHLLAAGIYFLCSFIYFSLSTVQTFLIEGPSKKFIVRGVLNVIILILLLILVICFPIALRIWNENNHVIPALKEPTNKGFGMILVCSILEWSIVMIIMTYTFTFMYDIRSHGLRLTIVPESDVAVVQESVGGVQVPTPSTDET